MDNQPVQQRDRLLVLGTHAVEFDRATVFLFAFTSTFSICSLMFSWLCIAPTYPREQPCPLYHHINLTFLLFVLQGQSAFPVWDYVSQKGALFSSSARLGSGCPFETGHGWGRGAGAIHCRKDGQGKSEREETSTLVSLTSVSTERLIGGDIIFWTIKKRRESKGKKRCAAHSWAMAPKRALLLKPTFALWSKEATLKRWE